MKRNKTLINLQKTETVLRANINIFISKKNAYVHSTFLSLFLNLKWKWYQQKMYDCSKKSTKHHLLWKSYYNWGVYSLIVWHHINICNTEPDRLTALSFLNNQWNNNDNYWLCISVLPWFIFENLEHALIEKL